MTWQITPSILVALVAAVISLALSFIAWQRRSIPGTSYLSAILLVNFWCLATSLFSMGCPSIQTRLFLAKAGYISIALLPTLWLAYALEFTGQTKWLLRRNLAFLAIEPGTSLLLVWTNEYHHLVWRSVELSPAGTQALLLPWGPWSWIHLVFAVLISLMGAGLLIRSLIWRQSPYGGQTTAMLIGFLGASTGAVIDLLSQVSSLYFTSLAITLAGLIVTFAMVRFRLLDIMPLARDSIVEKISDGLIVLDASNYIIDLNQAAASIMGCNTSQAVGKQVIKAWPSWPGEMTLPMGEVEIIKEVRLSDLHGLRYFDLRISSLMDTHNRLTGRLVVMRDVSRQKRAEEALHHRDDILEAISFAAERFLKKTDWEESVQEILARLGQAARVSRVYLFEIHQGANGQFLESLRFEWTAHGVQPQITNPDTQNQPMIEAGFGRWVELMGNGQIIHGLVKDLPLSEQVGLKAQDILSVASVPIYVGNHWWGYIGFDDCLSEREWTSVEVDALKAAASAFSAAIQRQQKEKEIHQRSEVISTLLNLSEIIGSTLDIPQVLDRVIAAAHSLMPIDRVAIFLWDEKAGALLPTLPREDTLSAPQLIPELSEQFARLRLSPSQVPLVRELQQKKHAIAISDAQSSSLLPIEFVENFRIKSVLAVPIVFQDRFVGALYVDYTRELHTFTLQEIELTGALARQAGLAIERARLYMQSQVDADELAALYRASTQLLNPGHDLRSLAEQITQSVAREFASAYCSVLWLDREANILFVLADNGFFEMPTSPMPLDGSGLTVIAATQGVVVYAPDVSQHPNYLQASPLTRSELVFPLRVGETVIGVLNLESAELDAFDERARRILAAFADDATLALQNVRLFNAADIHARQLTLLNEITHTALSSSEFNDMLQALADQMTNLIGSDDCYINLWDDEKQIVLPGIASRKMQRVHKSVEPEPGEATLTSSVLSAGKSLIIEDLLNTPYVSRRIAAEYSTRSALVLPMIAGELKLGSIIIGFDQAHHFTQREVALGEQVADQVALAVSKAWALETARLRAQEADNLRQATAAINSSLDLRQVLDSIMVHLEQVVPYDSACIFLLKGNKLLSVAGRGFPDVNQVTGKEYPVDELYLETQNLNYPTIITDAQNDPRYKDWGGTNYVRGWMGVPLHGRGTTIGYLTLDSRQAGAFNDRSAALALAFANQAAVAIENSQLFESARQRAQEAETLRQAGAIVAATLQQEEALQFILEQLARVVPYDSASVQLLTDGYLEIVGGLGWPEGVKSILGMRFAVPGENPNTIVIQQRRPYILGDAPGAYPSFTMTPHIRSWMGVPLIVRERVIGMLTMDSRKLNYFTENHARLASAFADQVAIAIENARLYSAEQTRVHQLDALRATAADLSAELELSRLLETILRRAVSLLKATGGQLGLYDEPANDLEIVASFNLGKDYTGTRMAMGEGAIGLVAKTRTAQIISDYKKWEGHSAQYAEGTWNTVMVSPLMVHGRLVGAIGIMDSDSQRVFDRNDLQLLTLFAQQAAIAVENARLYQEAREAAERRAVLHRVSQEVVTASFDPEQIYLTVHKAAAQLMVVEAFVITLIDDAMREVEAVYLIDRGGRAAIQRIPLHQGLSGRVITSGKSIYIPDFKQEKDWNGIHYGNEEHTRSILAVPLRTGDRVIGMLSAQAYQPHAYTTEDQHLLEMLAAHAAIAIENTRLIKEIQWLAITDPLTGLFNRRRLFELGQREVERFRRFNRPFSAIMIDIDHFKQVNDTHGHAVGDQVLIALAKSLSKEIRDIDIIGRYGGEEITVLLPETDIKSALQAAERLRLHVAEMSIQTDRGVLQVTTSLGVAEFRPGIPDLATLLDRADSAMYLAKQAGRNRVRAYEEVIKS